MRTLYILRHAKAQPDAPNGDWSRELIERGLREARLTGEHLRGPAARPDLIVTSDARRALHTAELVNAAFEPRIPMTIDHGIYDAGLDDLIRIVHRLDDESGRILLVGHNPGCEDLVSWLAGAGVEPCHMPTAALAHIEINVTCWRDLRAGAGKLIAMATPRSLRQ